MPPQWIVERRNERKKALLISFGAMCAAIAIMLGLLQFLTLDIEPGSWTHMELVKPRRGHARVETDTRVFAQFGYTIRHNRIAAWVVVAAVCGAMYGIQSMLRRKKSARKYLHGAHVGLVLIAGALFAMILIQTMEIRHGIQ